MYSKNTDDDWADDQNGKNVALSESRFVQRKVFNAGEDYVCTYDVINDIYLPGPQKFNFFYRVVDTYEINPLGRTLGYNWTDDRAEEVRATIREDALDVMQLYDGHEKFVYTLSPTTMQAIRSYNAKQDEGYSDWDLVCSDYGGGGNRGGYHCYSNFLECLVGGGGTGTGTSCTEIVGAYHDNGDYGITELNQNRSLLIQKQNALDGRG